MTEIQKIKYFKRCVGEAVGFFGLHTFRFEITSQVKEGVCASVYHHTLDELPDSDPRVFTICYSLSWINSDLDKAEIRTTVFHEVFESMFYRLRDFSTNSFFTVHEREVDSEIHKIIRLFENKILPLIKESKGD